MAFGRLYTNKRTGDIGPVRKDDVDVVELHALKRGLSSFNNASGIDDTPWLVC